MWFMDRVSRETKRVTTGGHPISDTVAHTVESHTGAASYGDLEVGGSVSGPGLIESVFWIGAVQLAQLVGVLLGVGLIMGSFQIAGGQVTGLLDLLERLEPELLTLLALGQCAVLLFAVVAVRWRVGRPAFEQLGWTSPSLLQLLLGVAMVLPIWLIASAAQTLAFRFSPPAREELSSLLQGLIGGPFVTLLFALAITPALAEELLFRGLIGRGLIGRWGPVWGVAGTSVLFGVAHGNVGQSLGVIPIGLALHFAYLVTGSLWLPIILHALNNSVAVLLLTFPSAEWTQSLVVRGGPGVPLLLVSAAVIVGACALLWETRKPASTPLATGAVSAGSRWGPLSCTRSAAPQPAFLLYGGLLFNLAGFVAILARDLSGS
jgi:membrane protease YdiL (CAAX protease family)